MDKEQNFQVNLQGLIDLLSNHLYAEPGVFIRELLQNGVDAITARRRMGDSFTGQVRVEVFSSHTLSVQDNGCGLTEADISQFLARIGSTTKKDDLDAADDFIGQFGIGLLSCFVVSDEIVLITRSAANGQSLEWRGKPDGTYTIKHLNKPPQNPGTTVYLKAKPDYEELFDYYSVRGLLDKYGEFLPTPIVLAEGKHEGQINEGPPPWAMNRTDALNYVEQTIYQKPMDIIPLYSTLGGVEGIAYILPYPVSLTEEKRHKVYLKNMLLSDKMTHILPNWAFFVNALVNSDSLRPTASREALLENDLFFAVREELGECIKQYLVTTAAEQPELFARILRTHVASIKAMAVEEEDLYELFLPHLSFETSFGQMDMATIASTYPKVMLTATLDEFRQVARVAKAQNLLVINGGYVHDFELVRKMNAVYEQVALSVVDTQAFSRQFAPLEKKEQQEAGPFLELADRILESYQCQSLIRFFEPADIPVLYTTSQEFNFFKLAEESEKEANPLFADIVRTIRTELYEKPYANLCFNYNNALVHKAVHSGDPVIQQACIELFYTQALLMGNHVLSAEELALMNRSLLQFMNMGLNPATEEGSR